MFRINIKNNFVKRENSISEVDLGALFQLFLFDVTFNKSFHYLKLTSKKFNASKLISSRIYLLFCLTFLHGILLLCCVFGRGKENINKVDAKSGKERFWKILVIKKKTEKFFSTRRTEISYNTIFDGI